MVVIVLLFGSGLGSLMSPVLCLFSGVLGLFIFIYTT